MFHSTYGDLSVHKKFWSENVFDTFILNGERIGADPARVRHYESKTKYSSKMGRSGSAEFMVALPTYLEGLNP